MRMVASGRCTCGQLSSYQQFSYVRNDPVNRVDPDGRQDFAIIVELGGRGLFPDDLLDWWRQSMGSGSLFFYSYDPEMGDWQAWNALMNMGMVARNLFENSLVAPPAGPTGPIIPISPYLTLVNTTNAISRAKTALLNQNCAELFGWDNKSGTGAANPSTILDILSSGGNDRFHIAYEEIPAIRRGGLANATTRVDGGSIDNVTGARAYNALITMNTDMNTSFNNGGVNDQAVTILHELGHAFNIVYGPGTARVRDDNPLIPNNRRISSDNSAYIKSRCGL